MRLKDTPLRPLLLDCDTGRDDALAIWLALALKLPLKAVVASYGNSFLENVTDNTSRVLALAGREDIPLFAGADAPPVPHRGFREIVQPRQKISGNGLCDVELPRGGRGLPPPMAPARLAAEIARLAQSNGPLDYIITGPATNFAAVCRELGRDVHRHAAQVTMWSGKLDGMWRQIPGADFNTGSDPYAIRSILQHGFEVRFMPMDATWPVCLTLQEVEGLRPSSDVAAAARDIMIAYCRKFAPEPVFRFHDPCVMMALLFPEFFQPAMVDVVCDEDGGDFGRIVRKPDGFKALIYDPAAPAREGFLGKMLETLGLSRN